MGIVDIIPWREKTARPVERQFCRGARFPLQMSWLSLPSVLGGTAFREPGCEMVDAPGEFVLTARLPGVRREEIKLTFRRRTLFLRAEHRDDEAYRRHGIKGWENSARSYFRAFRMPVKVEPKEAKVVFRKGVLRVRLPKARRAETPAWLVD